MPVITMDFLLLSIGFQSVSETHILVPKRGRVLGKNCWANFLWTVLFMRSSSMFRMT